MSQTGNRILRNGKILGLSSTLSGSKKRSISQKPSYTVTKKRKTRSASLYDLTSGNEWVSASRTRNYALKDPILDWLELYGESHGYTRDSKEGTEFNFSSFIMNKGHQFESHVVNLLKSRFGQDFVTIGQGHDDSSSIDKFHETLEAMKQGVPIIYQGVLHNSRDKTFGSPDLIVRSDWLENLVNTSPILPDEVNIGCKFSKNHHYRIVDVKFTTLRLYASHDRIQNYSSTPAYKAQLAVYNEALGLAQGVLPPEAYILGRGWKNASGMITGRFSNDAFDKLGSIDYFGEDREYVYTAQRAVEWIRRLQKYGHKWSPESARAGNLPSVPELYPNMSNSEDFPFHYAKKKIAEAIDEITRVWYCGVSNREYAHSLGKYRLSDVSVDDLNVRTHTQDVIASILDRNSQSTNFIVTQRAELSTDIISNDLNGWQTEEENNDMYVDFETVSNVNDDFSTFPKMGGTEMIWMIGCGFRDTETKEWKFVNFVADCLVPSEEYRIISEWLNFMMEHTNNPRVFHWSAAEKMFLARALDQHRELRKPNIDFVDMHGIFVKEPLTIKGAYDFKLKNIAKAFKKWGFIDTEWPNSYVDGIGSSVAAWKCDDWSRKTSKPLKDYQIIKEVEEYNEVDCKAIYEIVHFLRKNLQPETN